MKIIISHSETKREIRGSFSICGTQADLCSLAEQLLQRCQEDFTHGWVDIYSEPPTVLSNTPPKKWDE